MSVKVLGQHKGVVKIEAKWALYLLYPMALLGSSFLGGNSGLSLSCLPINFILCTR